MDEQEFSAPNFIPKDLLDIICILERDERRHSYKIVRNRTGFSLIAKFGAKNVESTPLKNNASVQQTASHQDKKQLSSKNKLRNKQQSVEGSILLLGLLEQCSRVNIRTRI